MSTDPGGQLAAIPERGGSGLKGDVVCILGMHRSGTSVVARISNILGLDLGPQKRHREALPDNPKGFWEYLPFVHLNNRLLRRHGGTWREPPAFPEGWAADRGLLGLRLRSRAAIVRDFGRSGNWGWKDPRTCVTVAFWRDLLPQMRTIICVRNPIDIARSLEERNGISFDEGLQLWLAYARPLMVEAERADATVVAYDALLSDPETVVAKIARAIGRDWDEISASDETRMRLGGLIEPSLRHSHTPEEVMWERSDVPAEAREIYGRLAKLAADRATRGENLAAPAAFRV